jgi:hypothetical protein
MMLAASRARRAATLWSLLLILLATCTARVLHRLQARQLRGRADVYCQDHDNDISNVRGPGSKLQRTSHANPRWT